MAIRVPVNPQTQAGGRTIRAIEGGRGADLSALGDSVRRAGQLFQHQLDKEKDEQKKLDSFDLSMKLSEEAIRLNDDFAQRQLDAEEGAPNFAERVNQDYFDQHTQFVQQARAAGFDEEALQNFELRLGSFRGSYAAKALEFQTASREAQAEGQVNQLATNMSRLAQNAPEDIEPLIEDFTDSVNQRPGLRADQKQKLIEQGTEMLSLTAGQSFALKNPKLTVEKLAPFLLDKSYGKLKDSTTSGRSSNEWANVALDVANELGLNPLEVGAVMSFETGGKLDPNLYGGDNKKYLGLIQFGPEEQKQYGIKPGASAGQWKQAILSFMKDRGFQKGMGIEDFYSTILTGSPGNYDRKDSNGTSVRNAIPRIISDHLANASKWFGDVPGITTEAPPELDEIVVEAHKLADVETGIPALDRLTGQQRLQIVTQARSRLDENDAETKADVQMRFENAVTAYQTTGNSAQRPTKEELVEAFGEVRGTQMDASLNAADRAGDFVLALPTKDLTTATQELEAMRPKDTASPSYKTDYETYEAAKQALATNREAREADPGAYVLQAFPNLRTKLADADTPEERRAAYKAIDNAYDKLGIRQADRTYFPKEQMEEVARNYANAAPAQKLQMLEGFLNEMPPAQAGKTLGGGKMEVAKDYALYSTLRTLPNYRNIMERVFAGKAAIAKDPSRRPKQAEINEAYRTAVGSAIRNLSPEYSAMINEAATALYVEGLGEGADDYEASLREVLGGNRDNDDTAIVDLTPWFSKAKDPTILPPRVDRDMFVNWTERLTDADLARLSVDGGRPVDRTGKPVSAQQVIDNGVIVMWAPGVYGIKSSLDGKPVLSSNGRPFRFNINRSIIRGN